MTMAWRAAPLGDADLLAAWTEGRNGPVPDRAIAMLAAAEPTASREELASWPLGSRDARLLDLREATFGPRVDALAECPDCGEPVALAFELGEVRVDGPSGHEAEPARGARSSASAPIELHVDDGSSYRLLIRLPSTADAAAAAEASDVDEGRRVLVRRCVVTAERDGAIVGAGDLSEGVTSAISAAISEGDPQADVRLLAKCPACGHGWSAAFDIAGFLWDEVSTRARHLLGEIHTLARAYGWTEQEILALPAERRQAYVEMVLG